MNVFSFMPFLFERKKYSIYWMKEWLCKERLRWEYMKEKQGKDKLKEEEIRLLLEYGIQQRQIADKDYFFNPCIKQLGVQQVSKELLKRFHKGGFLTKANVLRSYYYIFERGENATENNALEYKKRVEHLLPYFFKCENPVVRFYFPFGFHRGDFKVHFKCLPETNKELYYHLKEAEDIESIELLKQLSPWVDYDSLKEYFLFPVISSHRLENQKLLLSYNMKDSTRTIPLKVGDPLKLVLRNKEVLYSEIIGFSNKNKVGVLVKIEKSWQKIPDCAEVYLLEE